MLEVPGLEAREQAGGRVLLVGERAVIGEALGAAPPVQPNTTAVIVGLGTCLWLRPDRWLLLCNGGDRVETLISRINGPGAWALDVGSRYVGLRLRGRHAATALAAGCGLDLRPRSFGVGQCAQSRIGLVPAILWRPAEDQFEVMVERPLAHYFRLWLQDAASGIQEESGT